jgi:RimJ/RimL family protein N-acetyltransferase
MGRAKNKASARVLEKAGYKLEGILKKNKCVDGEFLDDFLYAKVR